jgi:formylglycine-generating enzyme required for sulfatase activity
MAWTLLSIGLATAAAISSAGSSAAPLGVKLIVRHHNVGDTSGDKPVSMVELDAGTFTMGISEKQMLVLGSGDNQSHLEKIVAMYPDHAQEVEAFFIDSLEVTNVQFKAYLDAKGLKPSDNLMEYNWFFWENGEKVLGKIPPERENHPVRGITFQEAVDCARWLGKRIPSEQEWEYAARHGMKKEQYFPWDDKSWKGWDKTQNANVHNSSKGNQGIVTSEVGAWKGDQTADGIFDLCGNVCEWTNSPFNPFPGWEPVEVKVRRKKKVFRAEFDSQKKTIRGGSIFGTMVSNNLVMRWGERPGFMSEGVGFRCVMSQVPGLDHLRQAERRLIVLNLDVKDQPDYSSDALAAQFIQYVDQDTKLVTGAKVFGFTRVGKLPKSPAKVKKESIEKPVLVGLFTTTQHINEPRLPAGDYAVYFKAKGMSEKQKAALKAKAEADKEAERKARDDRRKKKKGEDEPKEEEKPEPEEGQGEEVERELTEEEKRELAELDHLDAEKAKLGLYAKPLAITDIDLPTDQDILILKNTSGDRVSWLPANYDEAPMHPTRLVYLTGGAGGTGGVVNSEAPNAANVPSAYDEAQIQFTVKTVASSRYPQFILKLQFSPGAFEAITPPDPSESKGRRRR